MKVAIMQPYFMPYIGYFQLINVVDKFVILDDVNFIKKGWIHRNRILVNNNDYLFTIPLNKLSQNKLIKDISIAQDRKWKVNLLKTIKLTYQKAPYFSKVYPQIVNIINFDETNLSKYIVNSLYIILKYLEIDTPIVETSSIFDKNNSKGEERIISICTKTNADEYYNLIGGDGLYSKSNFKRQGMELKFISNSSENTYSIIDLLMRYSPVEIGQILNNYTIS